MSFWLPKGFNELILTSAPFLVMTLSPDYLYFRKSWGLFKIDRTMRNNLKGKNLSAGFAMAEVLIATVVLGFALMMMLLANTAIQHGSERVYERMVAT